MHRLGPGLLFAAAAVGVSHLVQSTRAGANFGLSLLFFVLLANAVKYPAFRFGPEYASATGESLLEGYRRLGRWAVFMYGALTLTTMFTVQAAVTVVTAGLAIAVFQLSVSALLASSVILALCALVLFVGGYRLLDGMTRVLVAVLTGSTLLATLLVLPQLPFDTWIPFSGMDTGEALFLAALFGWMPSAIDVSVWQSLWTLEQARLRRVPPDVPTSRFDFHVGYLGTAGLAVCFLCLGAGVLHAENLGFPQSASGFAAQLISMYGLLLGSWAEPLVGLAALAVMFSTTLAVLDGFPRAVQQCLVQFVPMDGERSRTSVRLLTIVLSLGALGLIASLLQSLADLVDVATVLSFLTAPILSWLNHRCMTASWVPASVRPGRWLSGYSVTCIGLQSVFAAVYLWLRWYEFGA
ncbi:MAG: NRAMP family divalent metal transporter [Myxococcota bacterium]